MKLVFKLRRFSLELHVSKAVILAVLMLWC